MDNLVIITGSGISKSSGIPTFRDINGVWENININKFCTYSGFKSNKEEFLNLYNSLRKKVLNSSPSKSHIDLVRLESKYNVSILTQNVDDLHERAGSSNVLHIHGNILKSSSTLKRSDSFKHLSDIEVGMKHSDGSQLIHDVVLFGDRVKHIDESNYVLKNADILLVLCTSLCVYPVNSFIGKVGKNCTKYYLDINPSDNVYKLFDFVIKGDSDLILSNLVDKLLSP